jgi:ubiquinone/menaquinone biosynthesis C-methylase UbiE
MWKQGYQFLSKIYKNEDWKFMNYGYAFMDDPIEKLNLENIDEDNRFFIQLYHHVACAVNLKDLKVLDVGSGRGGGAEYIKRYLKPKTMVGVDFSENTVALCNQNYTVNGLSFETGNAESLPFKNNSFDVVINVESSHCYNSMDAFLGQVTRVLHEGGYFLFADFREKKNIDIFREQIHNSGLILIKETDITANVLEALKLDNDRKIAEIKKKIGEALGLDNECKTTKIKKIIHNVLVKFILEFTGAKGSNIYDAFQNRKSIYLSFVLRKQTQ